MALESSDRSLDGIEPGLDEGIDLVSSVRSFERYIYGKLDMSLVGVSLG